MTTLLAIDPGASGGYAALHNGELVNGPMPDTEGDLLTTLSFLSRCAITDMNERVAFVEEVSGYCGEGQPGSAMFKFGRNFGFILGALQATGWKVNLVRPQKWQKSFGLGTKAACGSKSKWKNKLKAEAQRLFPNVTITLNTADAFLILEYARRTTNDLGAGVFHAGGACASGGDASPQYRA